MDDIFNLPSVHVLWFFFGHDSGNREGFVDHHVRTRFSHGCGPSKTKDGDG